MYFILSICATLLTSYTYFTKPATSVYSCDMSLSCSCPDLNALLPRQDAVSAPHRGHGRWHRRVVSRVCSCAPAAERTVFPGSEMSSSLSSSHVSTLISLKRLALMRCCFCADRTAVATHLPLAASRCPPQDEEKLMMALEEFALKFKP